MGVAIMNVQAMLGTEDIDKVIKLLEENDWEESDAVNAFYA